MMAEPIQSGLLGNLQDRARARLAGGQGSSVTTQFMRSFAENMRYEVLQDSKGDIPEKERRRQMQEIERHRRAQQQMGMGGGPLPTKNYFRAGSGARASSLAEMFSGMSEGMGQQRHQQGHQSRHSHHRKKQHAPHHRTHHKESPLPEALQRRLEHHKVARRSNEALEAAKKFEAGAARSKHPPIDSAKKENSQVDAATESQPSSFFGWACSLFR